MKRPFAASSWLPCRWEAYNVHESTMDFTIAVSVNTSSAVNASALAGSSLSTITLRPSYPRGVTDDRRVSAHLIGDLMPYQAFPVLTSSLLMMPQLVDLSNLQPKLWMLLDNNMVTMDGSECNKIGVGFSAFRCGAFSSADQKQKTVPCQHRRSQAIDWACITVADPGDPCQVC
jgi:hypothetical protein